MSSFVVFLASDMYSNTTSTVLDCLVLITCFISTIQCIRSIMTSARFSKVHVLINIYTAPTLISCTLSLSLSLSLKHIHTHVQRVRRVFRKNFNYKLKLSEYLPLYNPWFIGAVFSNILVAIGTVLYLITSYQVRQYI